MDFFHYVLLCNYKKILIENPLIVNMLYIGWSKIRIPVDFTYVAFEGYEAIAQAADETIDPKRKTSWIALMFTGCMVISVAVLFPIKVAAVFVSNSG